jgi:hypothetical protein
VLDPQFPPPGGRPLIEFGYPQTALTVALAESILEAVPLVSMRLLIFFDSEEPAYQGGRRQRNILDIRSETQPQPNIAPQVLSKCLALDVPEIGHDGTRC